MNLFNIKKIDERDVTNETLEPLKFNWPGRRKKKKKNKQKEIISHIEETSIQNEYNTPKEVDGSDWSKYNWDIEHTRKQISEEVVEITTSLSNANNKTTTSQMELLETSTITSSTNELLLEPEEESKIEIPEYDTNSSGINEIKPSVNETDEKTKFNLHSVADDLLNTANFEATLGTTEEIQNSVNININPEEVSESDEIKQYYENATRLLNEVSIRSSEGFTEIDEAEKKKIYKAADELLAKENITKSGTSKRETETTVTFPSKNKATDLINETSVSKSMHDDLSGSKKFWKKYNWDEEHTRKHTEGSSTFIKTTMTKINTTSTIKSKTTEPKLLIEEESNQTEPSEKDVLDVLPSEGSTEENENIILPDNETTSNYTELKPGVNETSEHDKQKLHNIADELLDESFEATLKTTPEEKIAPPLQAETVSESEEVEQYYENATKILANENIAASEGFTEMDANEKRKLFLDAEQLLQKEETKSTDLEPITLNAFTTENELESEHIEITNVTEPENSESQNEMNTENLENFNSFSTDLETEQTEEASSLTEETSETEYESSEFHNDEIKTENLEIFNSFSTNEYIETEPVEEISPLVEETVVSEIAEEISTEETEQPEPLSTENLENEVTIISTERETLQTLEEIFINTESTLETNEITPEDLQTENMENEINNISIEPETVEITFKEKDILSETQNTIESNWISSEVKTISRLPQEETTSHTEKMQTNNKNITEEPTSKRKNQTIKFSEEASNYTEHAQKSVNTETQSTTLLSESQFTQPSGKEEKTEFLNKNLTTSQFITKQQSEFENKYNETNSHSENQRLEISKSLTKSTKTAEEGHTIHITKTEDSKEINKYNKFSTKKEIRNETYTTPTFKTQEISEEIHASHVSISTEKVYSATAETILSETKSHKENLSSELTDITAMTNYTENVTGKLYSHFKHEEEGSTKIEEIEIKDETGTTSEIPELKKFTEFETSIPKSNAYKTGTSQHYIKNEEFSTLPEMRLSVNKEHRNQFTKSTEETENMLISKLTTEKKVENGNLNGNENYIVEETSSDITSSFKNSQEILTSKKYATEMTFVENITQHIQNTKGTSEFENDEFEAASSHNSELQKVSSSQHYDENEEFLTSLVTKLSINKENKNEFTVFSEEMENTNILERTTEKKEENVLFQKTENKDKDQTSSEISTTLNPFLEGTSKNKYKTEVVLIKNTKPFQNTNIPDKEIENKTGDAEILENKFYTGLEEGSVTKPKIGTTLHYDENEEYATMVSGMKLSIDKENTSQFTVSTEEIENASEGSIEEKEEALQENTVSKRPSLFETLLPKNLSREYKTEATLTENISTHIPSTRGSEKKWTKIPSKEKNTIQVEKYTEFRNDSRQKEFEIKNRLQPKDREKDKFPQTLEINSETPIIELTTFSENYQYTEKNVAELTLSSETRESEIEQKYTTMPEHKNTNVLKTNSHEETEYVGTSNENISREFSESHTSEFQPTNHTEQYKEIIKSHEIEKELFTLTENILNITMEETQMLEKNTIIKEISIKTVKPTKAEDQEASAMLEMLKTIPTEQMFFQTTSETLEETEVSTTISFPEQKNTKTVEIKEHGTRQENVTQIEKETYIPNTNPILEKFYKPTVLIINTKVFNEETKESEEETTISHAEQDFVTGLKTNYGVEDAAKSKVTEEKTLATKNTQILSSTEFIKNEPNNTSSIYEEVTIHVFEKNESTHEDYTEEVNNVEILNFSTEKDSNTVCELCTETFQESNELNVQTSQYKETEHLKTEYHKNNHTKDMKVYEQNEHTSEEIITSIELKETQESEMETEVKETTKSFEEIQTEEEPEISGSIGDHLTPEYTQVKSTNIIEQTKHELESLINTTTETEEFYKEQITSETLQISELKKDTESIEHSKKLITKTPKVNTEKIKTEYSTGILEANNFTHVINITETGNFEEKYTTEIEKIFPETNKLENTKYSERIAPETTNITESVEQDYLSIKTEQFDTNEFKEFKFSSKVTNIMENEEYKSENVTFIKTGTEVLTEEEVEQKFHTTSEISELTEHENTKVSLMQETKYKVEENVTKSDTEINSEETIKTVEQQKTTAFSETNDLPEQQNKKYSNTAEENIVEEPVTESKSQTEIEHITKEVSEVIETVLPTNSEDLNFKTEILKTTKFKNNTTSSEITGTTKIIEKTNEIKTQITEFVSEEPTELEERVEFTKSEHKDLETELPLTDTFKQHTATEKETINITEAKEYEIIQTDEATEALLMTEETQTQLEMSTSSAVNETNIETTKLISETRTGEYVTVKSTKPKYENLKTELRLTNEEHESTKEEINITKTTKYETTQNTLEIVETQMSTDNVLINTSNKAFTDLEKLTTKNITETISITQSSVTEGLNLETEVSQTREFQKPEHNEITEEVTKEREVEQKISELLETSLSENKETHPTELTHISEELTNEIEAKTEIIEFNSQNIITEENEGITSANQTYLDMEKETNESEEFESTRNKMTEETNKSIETSEAIETEVTTEKYYFETKEGLLTEYNEFKELKESERSTQIILQDTRKTKEEKDISTIFQQTTINLQSEQTEDQEDINNEEILNFSQENSYTLCEICSEYEEKPTSTIKTEHINVENISAEKQGYEIKELTTETKRISTALEKLTSENITEQNEETKFTKQIYLGKEKNEFTNFESTENEMKEQVSKSTKTSEGVEMEVTTEKNKIFNEKGRSTEITTSEEDVSSILRQTTISLHSGETKENEEINNDEILYFPQEKGSNTLCEICSENEKESTIEIINKANVKTATEKISESTTEEYEYETELSRNYKHTSAHGIIEITTKMVENELKSSIAEPAEFETEEIVSEMQITETQSSISELTKYEIEEITGELKKTQAKSSISELAEYETEETTSEIKETVEKSISELTKHVTEETTAEIEETEEKSISELTNHETEETTAEIKVTKVKSGFSELTEYETEEVTVEITATEVKSGISQLTEYETEEVTVELKETQSKSSINELTKYESEVTSSELGETEAKSSISELAEYETQETTSEIKETTEKSITELTEYAIEEKTAEIKETEVRSSNSGLTEYDTEEITAGHKETIAKSNISELTNYESELTTIELSETEAKSSINKLAEYEIEEPTSGIKETEEKSISKLTEYETEETTVEIKVTEVKGGISQLTEYETEEVTAEFKETQSKSSINELTNYESEVTSSELRETEAISSISELAEYETEETTSEIKETVEKSISELTKYAIEETTAEIKETEVKSSNSELAEYETEETTSEIKETVEKNISELTKYAIEETTAEIKETEEKTIIELTKHETEETTAEIKVTEIKSGISELTEYETEEVTTELKDTQAEGSISELTEYESEVTTVELRETKAKSSISELTEYGTEETISGIKETEGKSIKELTKHETEETTVEIKATEVKGSISELTEYETEEITTELKETQARSSISELTEYESEVTTAELRETEAKSSISEITEYKTVENTAEIKETEEKSISELIKHETEETTAEIKVTEIKSGISELTDYETEEVTAEHKETQAKSSISELTEYEFEVTTAELRETEEKSSISEITEYKTVETTAEIKETEERRISELIKHETEETTAENKVTEVKSGISELTEYETEEVTAEHKETQAKSSISELTEYETEKTTYESKETEEKSVSELTKHETEETTTEIKAIEVKSSISELTEYESEVTTAELRETETRNITGELTEYETEETTSKIKETEEKNISELTKHKTEETVAEIRATEVLSSISELTEYETEEITAEHKETQAKSSISELTEYESEEITTELRETEVKSSSISELAEYERVETTAKIKATETKSGISEPFEYKSTPEIKETEYPIEGMESNTGKNVSTENIEFMELEFINENLTETNIESLRTTIPRHTEEFKTSNKIEETINPTETNQSEVKTENIRETEETVKESNQLQIATEQIFANKTAHEKSEEISEVSPTIEFKEYQYTNRETLNKTEFEQQNTLITETTSQLNEYKLESSEHEHKNQTTKQLLQTTEFYGNESTQINITKIRNLESEEAVTETEEIGNYTKEEIVKNHFKTTRTTENELNELSTEVNETKHPGTKKNEQEMEVLETTALEEYKYSEEGVTEKPQTTEFSDNVEVNVTEFINNKSEAIITSLEEISGSIEENLEHIDTTNTIVTTEYYDKGINIRTSEGVSYTNEIQKSTELSEKQFEVTGKSEENNGSTEITTELKEQSEQEETVYTSSAILETGQKFTETMELEKLASTTVKSLVKNVTQITNYMNSKEKESSEEVKEDDLFNFSKEEGGSTLCEVCSEGEGISKEETHLLITTTAEKFLKEIDEVSTTQERHTHLSSSTTSAVEEISSTQHAKAYSTTENIVQYSKEQLISSENTEEKEHVRTTTSSPTTESLKIAITTNYEELLTETQKHETAEFNEEIFSTSKITHSTKEEERMEHATEEREKQIKTSETSQKQSSTNVVGEKETTIQPELTTETLNQNLTKGETGFITEGTGQQIETSEITEKQSSSISEAQKEKTEEFTTHIHSTLNITQYTSVEGEITEHTAKGTEIQSEISNTSQKEYSSKKGETEVHKEGKNSTKQSEEFLITLTESYKEMENFTTSNKSSEEILTQAGINNESFDLETATELGNFTEEEFHSQSISVFIKTVPTERYSESVNESGNTKTMVVIVNNSGKKIEKINETMLEKLLNKSISDLNLEYIDLHNISRKPEISTNKSEMTSKETLQSILPNNDISTCKKSEFDASDNCLCDVDNYIESVGKEIENGGNISLKEYHCNKFLRLKEGLVIGNNSTPTKRKKRSLLYLSNLNSKTNVIENDDIDNVFNDDYDLQASDKYIYALPGSNVKIPCHNKADNLLSGSNAKFSWEFRKDNSEEKTLPGNENILTIHNVEIKNSGNYTCTKTEDNGNKETFDHEMEIVTFPVYKIQMEVFYAINDSCSLSDGDILYSYLPGLLETLLCGLNKKMCKIDMQRPRCLSRNENNYFNVTTLATMHTIQEILPKLDDTQCDINCKLKMYSNAVGLVYKNADMVQRLPVLSRINSDIEFRPNPTSQYTNSDISIKPPKILTTCQAGYGIEKERQRVCVVCPKHTFSDEDEAFCKVCPAGQYQPTPGSKSCLACSSPVDDSMCLRMLYSDTSLFKIYVGVAFGMLVLIVLLILYLTNSGKSNQSKDATHFEGSLRDRAMRKKNTDIEKALLEPLLNDKNEKGRRNSPPKLPPPDF